MKKIKLYIFVLLLSFVSCKNDGKKATQTVEETKPLSVVTTTTMITDMVKAVGGNKVNVQGLMGSGVDPHLYKASEGDVTKLTNADVIIYNGLHLEGKLQDIFKKMQQRKKIVQLSESVYPSQLIPSENFTSNFDPHIWFNIDFWIVCTRYVATELARVDDKNEDYYIANADAYTQKLKKLKLENEKLIAELPEEKRILVTAHDAFNYFGKAYNFEVVGLQGLSTATEAGVKDVQNLAKLIIDKKVKAIFVETSVPKRTIEALQAAVKAKGSDVAIGGELFSDALGSPNTPEATYVGMYKHNVSTIVNALK